MLPILETIETILNLIQEGSSDYPDDLNSFACTLEALNESIKSLDEKKYYLIKLNFFIYI